MAIFGLFIEKFRERYFKIIRPVGNGLARIGIHPNVLSVSGLILSIIAGVIYSTGSFFWAACMVIVAGTCDALDGQVARQTHKKSPFGAFFDSTLDRYSDMFLLIGLAYHFAGGQAFKIYTDSEGIDTSSPWTVIVIVIAMAGFFMVSYTRARAEGLGVDCDVGLMQRSERIVLLIIGSLLGSIPMIGPILLKATLIVLAILSNFTAIHRMVYVRNQLLKENQDS